ncbi:MAG: hypothetical protein ACFE92_09865 [Promethearchaeota archaeon]
MCNSCKCDGFEQCSIVGYMPQGFCCQKCDLYTEELTCLKTMMRTKVSRFEPVSAKIKDGVLKVVIKKDEKEIPLVINLDKQFESE